MTKLASGVLIEALRLRDMEETFYAVSLQRRFPNPLLAELLGDGARATKGP